MTHQIDPSAFQAYAASTGQDPNDELTRHFFEQEQRKARRGLHGSSCSGYNERPCDCGVVDRIEQERDALYDRLDQAHREKQRLLHENERLREQVREEVRASQQTYGLEVHCDGRCGVTPLRIKVPPPEDAVALWIAGHGWLVTEDNHYCRACGETYQRMRDTVAASRTGRASWPTDHESDCPVVDGKGCRCPMGNL